MNNIIHWLSAELPVALIAIIFFMGGIVFIVIRFVVNKIVRRESLALPIINRLLKDANHAIYTASMTPDAKRNTMESKDPIEITTPQQLTNRNNAISMNDTIRVRSCLIEDSSRSFEIISSAWSYLLTGNCLDRAALVLELETAIDAWCKRMSASDRRVFDFEMHKKRMPEPEDLLAASIFLGNQECYDFAKKLIGDIESDAYYSQKYEQGLSKEDLGNLHSASEVVVRNLQWRIGIMQEDQQCRVIESVGRLDPKVAMSLRKA